MTPHIYVRLKEETHSKLKLICVKDRISMQRFVEDLIEETLKKINKEN